VGKAPSRVPGTERKFDTRTGRGTDVAKEKERRSEIPKGFVMGSRPSTKRSEKIKGGGGSSGRKEKSMQISELNG